ncbi:MAG: branched-chain amino acid ABC transporter permease [Erysipelotrichaceae bacterium]|nr:branched-chain amino acid ABC transporter permease [Erysipelotrichaceae bacterium]
MSTFIQLVTRSLETGSIYALAALGIIIIFRTSSITHFAQGAMAMFNTFVVTIFYINFHMPLWMALLGGIASAFLSGFLVDFLIIRHTKKVSPVAKQIMTLGLIMVFVGVIPLFFGVEPLNLPKFFNSGEIAFLGAKISYNGLFNISFGLILMFVLFYILQKTKWGLAVRTTASNDVVARMMGVPTRKVTMAAWAIAAGLGVIAGVMNAPTTTVTPNLMDSVQLNALIACVLGGFQTFYGPVLGAYIIGIVKNLFVYYISSVWGDQLLYISILVFIVFRPHGLIGKKVIKKV